MKKYIQATHTLRFFVMNVLMRPDEETLSAMAEFFAGNTSSPVIHRSETAGAHIQALYWVWNNCTSTATPSFFVAVRWNVLTAAMEKSDRHIRCGLRHLCDVRSDMHMCLSHQQVPQVRDYSVVTTGNADSENTWLVAWKRWASIVSCIDRSCVRY